MTSPSGHRGLPNPDDRRTNHLLELVHAFSPKPDHELTHAERERARELARRWHLQFWKKIMAEASPAKGNQK